MLRLEQMFVWTLVSWSRDDLGCKNCPAHFESNEKSIFKATHFFSVKSSFFKIGNSVNDYILEKQFCGNITLLCNLSTQVVSFRKLNIFVGVLCSCNLKVFSFNSKGGENEKHLHYQSYICSQNFNFFNSWYQNLSLMFAVAQNCGLTFYLSSHLENILAKN